MKTFIKILYFVVCVFFVKNFWIFFFGPNANIPLAILGFILYIFVFAPIFMWGWNHIEKRKQ